MLRIEKIPIIKTGTMVYFKEDPDRMPYRWKCWDHVEKIVDNTIGFCNKKDEKYKYIITFLWKIVI